jgi:hypothetical protein
VADNDYLQVGENFASCCTLQVSEAALVKTEGRLTKLTITTSHGEIGGLRCVG